MSHSSPMITLLEANTTATRYQGTAGPRSAASAAPRGPIDISLTLASFRARGAVRSRRRGRGADATHQQQRGVVAARRVADERAHAPQDLVAHHFQVRTAVERRQRLAHAALLEELVAALRLDDPVAEERHHLARGEDRALLGVGEALERPERNPVALERARLPVFYH